VGSHESLTPNRKGTSPVPSDIFFFFIIDQSIQVGLTWARQPQFRVIYHANRTVTFAVSLEEAEQYGGGSAGAGEITLPAALSSSYASQLISVSQPSPLRTCIPT
jgi:hypothetical protein